MRLTLVAVGRLRPYFRDAVDEYLKRLRRFWPISEIEVREASRAGNRAVQRREEGSRVLARVPEGSYRVALARQGAAWSSDDLAKRLQVWGDTGRQPVFLIGGSEGFPEELVAEADARWSLGPLTLPHQLARVVVAEQLYRGATVLQGHPYHKGGR